MLNIPFNDLRHTNRWLEPVISRVLQESNYILGPHVEAFESAWAGYCKAKYCVGVDNGLEALKIALEACGVGKGDEVIVPSHTYIATWLAVSHVGATPVPVEPKPGSFLIDADSIKGAITSKTKAIIPVHLYGEVCDMFSISALASVYGIKVIEDSAQSHGIPLLGHVGCYSFYPTKNLGAIGDAGGIVTNDPAIEEKARLLRNYGMESKDCYRMKGYNARLDELQAAVLLDKLPKLNQWNEQRRQQALFYDKNLKLDGKPKITDGRVWHQYVIQHPARESLKSGLEAMGIGTRVHYPTPPHKQPCYSECSTWNLPIAERYAKTVLSLPFGYDFDIQAVCDAVNEITYKLRRT